MWYYMNIMSNKGFIAALVCAALLAPGMALAKDNKNPSADQILKAFRNGKSITITQRGDYDDLVRTYHAPRYPYASNYPLGHYPPPGYYTNPAPNVYVRQGGLSRWRDQADDERLNARSTGYIAGKIID